MLKIYGYSDDLIELQGCLDDEIPCYNTVVRLGFPDGTKIRVKYGKEVDGETLAIWAIEVIERGEKFLGLVVCTDENESYSDELRLDFDDLSFDEIELEAGPDL